MKIRNIILFLFVFCALSQCKKEPEEPYSNEHIILDNAQAALFFHVIFREAENAWAFIHEKNYESGTYHDPENKPNVTKSYTYNVATNDVTINYNAWPSNNLLLVGTLRVGFRVDSYRIDGSVANVYLSEFSIDGNDIRGVPSIKRSSDNKYTYNFIDGAVYERGVNMPVLITGKIENGQYERIEGGDTFTQDDDVWAYSGTMTGMLHDNPKLNYTNKVLTSYIFENGDNGVIHFTMDKNCLTAKKGVSEITIKDRPDITFGYFCTDIKFISVEHVR